MKAKITGVGHYLPDRIISNDDLANRFEISAEKIFQKTGIKERRYLDSGGTSYLVVEAVRDLVKKTGVALDNLDCLILGTTTPDYFFPSTAAAVLNEIETTKAFGFDVSAACAGFMYGFHLGRLMIETGEAKKIIVCGGDKMSSTLNNEGDYKTSVLFGDGAGAVLLETADDSDENIVFRSVCSLKKDGLSEVYLKTGLNSKQKRIDLIHMEGRLVYASGVEQMAKSITDYLTEVKLSFDDIDYLVPHQANLRMLESVAERINFSRDKLLINIEKTGNTGSATIPICLSQYSESKTLKRGDRLLLVGFGAGYSSAVGYLKWSI